MFNLESWFDRHALDAVRLDDLKLMTTVLWWRLADEQTNYWREGMTS